MAVSMSQFQRHVGDNIDKIMSLEFRDRRPAQGTIAMLYEAARTHHGRPLTMLAAMRITDRVTRGSVVFLLTGAGDPRHVPVGETDGPLGAAGLARALAFGLGAVPIIFTHPDYVDNVRAVVTACGVALRPIEAVVETPCSAAVVPFQAGAEAADRARAAITRNPPAAMVAIEVLAPNQHGVAHTAEGLPADPARAPFERFIELGAQRGILTIGIGDNGNEIGFGLIEDQVKAVRPCAAKCRCPCGGGLASSVATDCLVAAGISNWGAYGIAACLAALLERPDVLHDAEAERFMLHEAIRTGGVDSSGSPTLAVDGVPLAIHLAVLELMRGVVVHGLKPARKRAF